MALLLAATAPACVVTGEDEPAGEQRESGVLPFYRKVTDGDHTEVQVLWPIFHHEEEPGRSHTKLIPLWWQRSFSAREGAVDVDWGLLALIMGGHDTEEGSYFLFFPFWGNLKGLLHKDEMRFRLFPLYLDTRRGEFEATHLLWPLISWGEGDGRDEIRILPFYSHRSKEGRRWRTSVLWPFFTWGEHGLNTAHPTKSFLFFPLYGESDSDIAWSRTFLFPFFSFAGSDRGYSETHLFWPIFMSIENPGKRSALRVWPLFGRDRQGEERNDYYLWPIIRSQWLKDEHGWVESYRVAPLWRRRAYFGREGEDRGFDMQLWPLYSREWSADGSARTSLLSPIPFLGWEDWEENYGWLWTLYRSSRDAAGGERGSALFGTLSWSDVGGRDEVQLLKGLLGYESSEEGGALRLLWLFRIPL